MLLLELVKLDFNLIEPVVLLFVLWVNPGDTSIDLLFQFFKQIKELIYVTCHLDFKLIDYHIDVFVAAVVLLLFV